MNAPEVEAKLANSSGRIARLIKAGTSRPEMIEELCFAALCRPSGDKERQVAERLFSKAPAQTAAEDFLWTLLNSYEFLFVQ